MNFCFIHRKGSDGGMCRCISQNVLKASGLRSPDKMPMSILSTSRRSYLQNRWNLREEKGEESLCLWGLVQNRYSWKGYHSTEEKMREETARPGRETEGRAPTGRSQEDWRPNSKHQIHSPTLSCGLWEANLSHSNLPSLQMLSRGLLLSFSH